DAVPCGPVKPVGPVGPVAPVFVAAPGEPVFPVTPVAPVGPVLPVGPVGPTKIVGGTTSHPFTSVYSSAVPGASATLYSCTVEPPPCTCCTVIVFVTETSLFQIIRPRTLRWLLDGGDGTIVVVVAVEIAVFWRPGVIVADWSSTHDACTSTFVAEPVMT